MLEAFYIWDDIWIFIFWWTSQNTRETGEVITQPYRCAWWRSFAVKSFWLHLLTALNGLCSRPAPPLLWCSYLPQLLSLLSSLLLSRFSRVTFFPITFRGTSCTWTVRWGPFLFLTSCLSLTGRLFISMAYVLAQIKLSRLSVIVLFSGLEFSVPYLIFLSFAEVLKSMSANTDDVP